MNGSEWETITEHEGDEPLYLHWSAGPRFKWDVCDRPEEDRIIESFDFYDEALAFARGLLHGVHVERANRAAWEALSNNVADERAF